MNLYFSTSQWKVNIVGFFIVVSKEWSSIVGQGKWKCRMSDSSVKFLNCLKREKLNGLDKKVKSFLNDIASKPCTFSIWYLSAIDTTLTLKPSFNEDFPICLTASSIPPWAKGKNVLVKWVTVLIYVLLFMSWLPIEIFIFFIKIKSIYNPIF